MNDNGVLVLTGPPCAGKSAIGRALTSGPSPGTRRRRIHVEVDSLFSLLLPGLDRNRADRMLGYDAAHLLARMLLDQGHMPVLECTYSRRQQRTSLLQACRHPRHTPVGSGSRHLPRRRRPPVPTATPGHGPPRAARARRARTFPYSDQALRLASATAAPDNLAQQITAWLRLQPEPTDRARWAEAGKTWD